MNKQASYRINVALAPVKAEPSQQAMCTSECLYGEVVHEVAKQGEWSHIRLQRDDYEGFVHNDFLEVSEPEHQAATHVVHTRSTLLFSQPSLKSRVAIRIPFHARLCLRDTDNDQFAKTDSGLFVWRAHTSPIGTRHTLSPIALARSHFLGAPYLWGGCSPSGLDCSGLIQALAHSQAIPLPRDSKEQETAITTTVNYEDRRIGDLLYWPGHTGILVSENRLLHATAYSLSCREEALANVLDRAGAVSSVRRLFSESTST